MYSQFKYTFLFAEFNSRLYFRCNAHDTIIMDDVLKDKSLLKDKCFINGTWISSDNKATISIYNPFNQKIIAKVPELSDLEILQAIDSADAAFISWKALLAGERAGYLMEWHRLILENTEDLAKIMVLEQGKPLKEAIGEIKYAASYIEFYAEEAKRIYGDIIPSPFKDVRIFILKQPVGVVGIITPWNFPAAMMIRKIAPALAAGCTCVVKPDEKTPLTAFALAELSARAGIPKGVLNIITGVPENIGNVLTDSEKIKKISFTGSAETGKLLMKKSAHTLKKVTLELGGNAPFIVFEDANIDQAIDGLIDSKFRNAGQTCVCANRVFVHKNIRTRFEKLLIGKVKKLTLGNGLDPVDIGPMINQKAIQKIEHLLSEAIKKGANLISGGRRQPSIGINFFEPTILSGVDHHMEIFQTEIFGPVITLIEFEDTDEVIRSANNTKSGLAGYFYSNNLNTIWKVAENLECGMVGVNSGIISSACVPFGGIKESGFGREGSKYGIDDYVYVKYIHLKS